MTAVTMRIRPARRLLALWLPWLDSNNPLAPGGFIPIRREGFYHFPCAGGCCRMTQYVYRSNEEELQ